MAQNGALLRDAVLALEIANKLLAQKLLDERVSALQKARELSNAGNEIANLKSDILKLEEERNRLVDRIDELEKNAVLMSASSSPSDEAEFLRNQLEKAEAVIKLNQDKLAELDRTNSDEKDQLATEIDTLRKKLTIGGGSTSTLAKLRSEIDEKDALILEQDSIIEDERSKAKTFEGELHAERQRSTRVLDEKEKTILNLQQKLSSGHHDAGGSGTQNDELLPQFNALKETYAQEMEKKKQFSLVFLKLKSEFEEQKKKIAAYESGAKK